MLAGLLALATTIGVITTPIAPLRYKIEMKSTQEVDLAAMGQGKQTGDVSIVAFVSVTMSDSANGQLAHVVVDSMTAAPTGSMSGAFDASLAGTAKGAFFHLFVVNGKVQGTPKPSAEGNAVLTTLGNAVVVLFPGTMKSGLKVGDSYADTATTNATTEQGTSTQTAITTWNVKSVQGDEVVVEGSSTGKMSLDGGQMAASGTSKGTRTMTSTPKGPVKSASANTDQDIAAIPAGMSDPIPVKVTSTMTITQIN